MLFSEVLRKIQFKIGSLDDITGKAVNPLINNRQIVDELNSQLNQYANVTKGIQDIYSISLATATPAVPAPPLVLRSAGYKYMFVISQGAIFSMDMRPERAVYPIFRNSPINGLTNWVLPWSSGKTQYLSLFPTNNTSFNTTTLSSDIGKADTTIPVVSTTGFIANSGRITIGDEKIFYGRKDSTNFYDCIRGLETTTAVDHSSAATVNENNVWFWYSRLHAKIVITDDMFIDESVLDTEMDVVEEHLEGIIKSVAYNLLIKIDPDRAAPYKYDYDELFEEYRMDIRKGYYRGRMGTNTRNPHYGNELGLPYGPNFSGF